MDCPLQSACTCRNAGVCVALQLVGMNVDPAVAGTGQARPYADDPILLARMAESGYYDIPAEDIRAWAARPAPARRRR